MLGFSIVAWLALGFINWVIMLLIRLYLKDLPDFSRVGLKAYLKGFLLAIGLGPISLFLFTYLLVKEI